MTKVQSTMKKFDLENQKIASGFKIPDGYFENFGERLNNRLDCEVPVIAIAQTKNRWYLTAAAVAVLMVSIPAINFLNAPKQAPDVQSIENYLALNHESTTFQLTEELTVEELQRMTIELSLSDAEIESTLDKENIENLIN